MGSLLFAFLLWEGAFRTVVNQSDGFGLTLVHKRWMERFWKPINRFGYRDANRPDALLARRHRLFVVGDSFVAGHGIRNPADRFPDVAGRSLPDEWVTVIIARPGWNSEDELAALTAYPHRPHLIVLSHYVDDLQSAWLERGLDPEIDLTVSPGWLSYLVDHSYALNFLYWRSVRIAGAQTSYMSFLQRAYADPDVWAAHERTLSKFVEYARVAGAPLLVLVWPGLFAIDASRPLTAKVAAFFAAAGVPSLDLSVHFEGRDPRDLVVNGVDAHPNEAVHREVAGLLVTALRSLARDRDLSLESPR
jgi:hypothetical protein